MIEYSTRNKMCQQKMIGRGNNVDSVLAVIAQYRYLREFPDIYVHAVATKTI